MKDLVSIIIPCYNYGNVVKKALYSVKNQTYENIEIIVVNDGSTDELTLITLENIKKTEPDIKIINQENAGLAAARNTGVLSSKGEFLFFLDNDDSIHPKTIEILLHALLENPKYAYVYSEVYYHGNIPDFFAWKPQEFNQYDLLWANHPTLSSLIRKEAHILSGGFSENLIYGWEDWEYWLKLSKKGYYGKLIPIPLYLYWRHGKTMAHDAKEKADYSVNILQKNNPEVYNPHFIIESKIKWRPIVSIILFDCSAIVEILASVLNQTLIDKQILILTENKSKLQKRLLRLKGDITIITVEENNFDASLNKVVFNEILVQAKGDFCFLLKQGILLCPTVLEELIWKKIYDKKSAYHYYYTQKEKTTSQPVIPEDIIEISALTIETQLLCFAGGFNELIDFQSVFYDIIARLDAVKLEGLCVYNKHLLHIEDMASNVKISEDYFEFPSLKTDLSLLTLAPIMRESQNRSTIYSISQQLREEILSDFSFPHYAESRNQRLNFPCPVRNTNTEKNILFLVPYMIKGGAEKVDLDILEALTKDEYKITIVTEKKENHSWRKLYEKYTGEIFHLDEITENYENKINFLQYLLISRNISIVFIRSSAIGYHFAKEIPLSIRNNIKIVDLLHAYNRHNEDWIDYSTPFDKFLHERLVISNELKSYLVANYQIDQKKISVLHNGVSTDFFSDTTYKGWLRKKIIVNSETRIIGFIGRLVDDKDPLKWIEIAAEVNKYSSDVHFVIVGDGELKEAILEKIATLGLKNITLLGWHEQINQVLPDLDILLMTSKNEGLPLVILEAISAGVQVVAPKVGAIEELINNNYSILLNKDDEVAAYVTSIVKLLLLSPATKKHLRSEAVEFIKKEYDITIFQKRYTDKFNLFLSSLDHKKRKNTLIKNLILEEFIKDDYRAYQHIYHYKNLQAYFLAEIIKESQYKRFKEPSSGLKPQHLSEIASNKNQLDKESQIADWYYHQYEVLPGWYKKIGHLIKAVLGKRSFKSLLQRNDKEEASTISVQQWYNNEYEILPLWYKRVGHIIKIMTGKRKRHHFSNN